ncbi:hypothetical protein BJ508DRAFT_309767 [Ascobolus immersus RN42]|uniref:Uncharacterized protein n=1 Tax=Ascobolus immersus RN42 TaxID=1160509 RepID=A0A3N4I113_ASCIM|nr:hypothetical protein BJ508DRAFT_309767 [Ascobolus immersus RN42]
MDESVATQTLEERMEAGFTALRKLLDDQKAAFEEQKKADDARIKALEEKLKQAEDEARIKEHEYQLRKKAELLYLGREYLVRKNDGISWAAWEGNAQRGSGDYHHDETRKGMIPGWKQETRRFINLVACGGLNRDKGAIVREFKRVAEDDEELLNLIEVMEKGGFWDPGDEGFNTKYTFYDGSDDEDSEESYSYY